MQGRSRTLAVWVLIALAAALPGVQAFALPTMPSHSAGCHRHSPATPSPAQNKYRCCVSRHHQALPSASVNLRAMVTLISIDAIQSHGAQFPLDKNAATLHFASASPPNTTPLRI